MSITFCFVTKDQGVTNEEIAKIQIEFHKNNFEIIEQYRLGKDGVLLEVLNFSPKDFSYLEKTLALDINFWFKEVEVKKMLLADMDSTIISVECINELAEYGGVRSEVELLTKKAMSGEMDFVEALKQRVKLLKGLTHQQLADCYNTRISLNKGAKTLVKTMNSFGSISVIVSGGFSFFANKVAQDIGFDQAFANHLVFDGSILSGVIKSPILGTTEKKMVLQKLCTEGNFALSDVIAVGDGANDIDIVTSAGIGVSYYGNMRLTEKSDFKLYYSNLRALLYFQGIKESDFITK